MKEKKCQSLFRIFTVYYKVTMSCCFLFLFISLPNKEDYLHLTGIAHSDYLILKIRLRTLRDPVLEIFNYKVISDFALKD
jgi:hypothetical protein